MWKRQLKRFQLAISWQRYVSFYSSEKKKIYEIKTQLTRRRLQVVIQTNWTLFVQYFENIILATHQNRNTFVELFRNDYHVYKNRTKFITISNSIYLHNLLIISWVAPECIHLYACVRHRLQKWNRATEFGYRNLPRNWVGNAMQIMLIIEIDTLKTMNSSIIYILILDGHKYLSFPFPNWLYMPNAMHTHFRFCNGQIRYDDIFHREI